MMNKEEIQEILNKLSNRKQETLLKGLRECQLKNIEHPFITKEEYIDKILDYINNLQERISKAIEILKDGLLQLDTRPREQVYSEQYLENAIEELGGKE